MGGNLFRPFYFESLKRFSDVPLYDAAVHPTRLTPAEDWLLASGCIRNLLLTRIPTSTAIEGTPIDKAACTV